MKHVGLCVLIFGIVLGFYGLGYETTISTGDSRVYNIGLMDQKRNLLMIAGLGILVGVILLIAGLQEKYEDPPNNRPPSRHKNSTADELVKLAKLVETGLLTKSEFQSHKEKLLGINGASANTLSEGALVSVSSPVATTSDANMQTVDLDAKSIDFSMRDANECVAALESLSFKVIYFPEGGKWEITSPSGTSTSYAYSISNLRKIAAREFIRPTVAESVQQSA